MLLTNYCAIPLSSTICFMLLESRLICKFMLLC